nr:MAG TPA: hypothetical protein [Caudoviricetes sp.]
MNTYSAFSCYHGSILNCNRQEVPKCPKRMTR